MYEFLIFICTLTIPVLYEFYKNKLELKRKSIDKLISYAIALDMLRMKEIDSLSANILPTISLTELRLLFKVIKRSGWVKISEQEKNNAYARMKMMIRIQEINVMDEIINAEDYLTYVLQALHFILLDQRFANYATLVEQARFWKYGLEDRNNGKIKL